MCLKQAFSHSKWVLHTILSLTVLSNCVFVRSNFDTAFLSDCTKFCSVFFRLLDRKFNEVSKNVFKTVVFLLQVSFTDDFVPDCAFKLFFVSSNFDTAFISLTVQNFVGFLQVIR